MNVTKFREASKAAELWLNAVQMVVKFGEEGAVGQAYKLLMPSVDSGISFNLHDSYFKHIEVLDEANTDLTALSDGPVKWDHGRGSSAVARVPSAVYPHTWSNAHEAATGVVGLAMELLVHPLEGISDRDEQWKAATELLARGCEALVMSMDEVAELQERIRWERAKYDVVLTSRARAVASSQSTGTSSIGYSSRNGQLPNESKVCEDEVPAAYREGGKVGGKILTANYLASDDGDWNLLAPYLTRNFGPDKTLTDRIRIGKNCVYLYVEVAALRTSKTANASKKERRNNK